MVGWVSYPGLPSHTYHKMAQKYMRRGIYGSVLCVGVKGGVNSGLKFTESVKLVSDLPCNIRREGGQSLVIWRVIPCSIRRKGV